MTNLIHSTAVIGKGATLSKDVEVGAYAVVGENVSIGDRTKIHAHVNIDGYSTFGCDCVIYPFASIGTQTQDLKYTGAKTTVLIGDRTVIREYVTINSATEEGEETRVGSDCFLMAYCHVAHKCVLGNSVVMANCTQLAGHVVIDDGVGLGGMVGIHQFVRIGSGAFVGGFSRIAQDVPPFLLVEGVPAVARGLNSVGLKRKNIAVSVRATLKNAFRFLYRSELSTSQAVEKIKSELESCSELEYFVQFIEASERGVIK